MNKVAYSAKLYPVINQADKNIYKKKRRKNNL